MSRPDRIREWTYEFDPSGLELLRRAIEHVQAGRTSVDLDHGAASAAGQDALGVGSSAVAAVLSSGPGPA
jgi:hypothetical protein